MFKKIVLGLLGILCIAGSGIAIYISNEIDAQHVRLRFERGSSLFGARCPVDIYLDGAKLGSINNDEEKEFLLPPDGTSEYTIGARLIPGIGSDYELLERSISAPVGSVIYARYEIDGWVLQWRAKVKLDLALERAPIPRSNFLPQSLTNAASNTVARFTPQQVALPWDAIGAIAGVFGTLVAILALFK